MDQDTLNNDSVNNRSTPTESSTDSVKSNPATPEPQSTDASKRLLALDSTKIAPSVSLDSKLATVSTKPKTKALFIALVAVGILAASILGIRQFTQSDSISQPVQSVIKKEIPVLRIGTVDPVFNETFYPPSLPSVSSIVTIRRQVFESLVAFENKTQITPLLATSWSNPDLNTWVFKLKPNVKFHNGNAFTANSAKASIEAAITKNPDNLFTDTIQSVDAVDNFTLKVSTSKPDTTLLNKLTFISMYDTTSAVTDSKTGSGPYIVSAGDEPGSLQLSLSSIDNYHGGNILTKEIKLTAESDTDKLAQLLINNVADSVQVNTDAALEKIKTAIPKVTINEEQAIGATGMYLNPSSDTPLKNLAVRKAIYQGLDIAKIVEAGKAKAIVASQFTSSAVPGYNPTIIIPVRDTVAAKKALANAGFENGFSLNLKAGSASQGMADEIALELAEIGIKVSVEVVKTSSQLFTSLETGTFDAAIASYTTDINDASDVISSVYQGGAYKNFYTSEKLNAVMNEASGITDPSKRLAKLQDASKIIMEDVPFIPLRVRTTRFATNGTYVLKPDFTLSGLVGSYYWKAYQTE